MRQWLVVAMLAWSAAAHADAKCPEPKRMVLPAEGAVDVPLNAKTWAFEPGVIKRDHVVETHELPLEPKTRYQFDDLMFTTGTDVDTERPAPPKDVEITFLTATDGNEPMSLSMMATTSPDTAWVRVEIADPSGPLAFAAEHNFTVACDAGIRLAPGDVRVTLRAVDLAGNTSEPVSMTVRVYKRPEASSGYRRTRVYTQKSNVGFVLALVAITIFSIAATGGAARKQRQPRPAPAPVEIPLSGEPISLSVAEAAIELLRWRHVLATGISAVLAAAGMFISEPIGFVPGIVLMGYAGQLIADTLALRNARIDRTIAWREGKLLVLRGPWGCSQLSVSNELLAAAQRAAIPTASIERRDG